MLYVGGDVYGLTKRKESVDNINGGSLAALLRLHYESGDTQLGYQARQLDEAVHRAVKVLPQAMAGGNISYHFHAHVPARDHLPPGH